MRRLIDELYRGQPDYTQMSPAFADLTRQQLPQLQAAMQQLGTVQTVTFTGVAAGGLDMYEVKFENGAANVRILLDADGKVVAAGLQPG